MKVFLRKQVFNFIGLCLPGNLRGGALRREKGTLGLGLPLRPDSGPALSVGRQWCKDPGSMNRVNLCLAFRGP